MDGTHRGSADRSGMPDTCTGMPSPVPDVDFTVRSAALARAFTDGHHLPGDIRELVANAIAMHYTPGLGLESGAEAYLLSAGAAVDVFGLRSNEIPDAVRRSVIQGTRGGLQAGVRRASPSRGQASPSWPRLVPAPLRHERPEHSARALPWLITRPATA